jgi:ABC-type phosphate transport system permease subunit
VLSCVPLIVFGLMAIVFYYSITREINEAFIHNIIIREITFGGAIVALPIIYFVIAIPFIAFNFLKNLFRHFIDFIK